MSGRVGEPTRSHPSAMFYCHEGLGIGHIQRAAALGQYFHRRWPGMRQLLVASSAGTFVLPPLEQMDVIKLPAVLRVAPEETDTPFVPRVLPISSDAVLGMRRDIALSIVRHYQPDLLLVDYWPAGIKDELVPALRYLVSVSPSTKLLLGVRDIADEAPRLRRQWGGAARCLVEDLYHRILVYGQQDVFDFAEQAALSVGAAAKVRYVGYIRRGASRPAEQVRAELRLQTGRLVLVTVGGGTDGYEVIDAMREAVARWPEQADFDCLLVAGPLMPAEQRGRLRARLSDDPRLRLVDRLDDLVDYLAAADVVVARAGYNTVCEILTSGRPAVLVPRVLLNGVADNQEQLLRAQALEARGLAKLLHPAELTPRRLLDEVCALLREPVLARTELSLDGLPGTLREVEGLLAR